MHTRIRHMLSKSALVVLIVLTLSFGGVGRWEAQAAQGLMSGGSARTVKLAAVLPAATCTPAGPSARTCDLWATSGILTLPGAVSMPVWGYADTALGSAQVPGPALIVNEGETITVTLHNNLGEASALLFHGQALPPDLTGASAGGTAIYVFTATNPGTYLYEAGLLPNAQHQVAMGLYGALVVRPTVTPPVGFIGQAYTDPATAFTDEALLVLGEIDPALNNSLNPATFDMRDYAPKYYLINGKAYPNTDEITTTVGVTSTVLLRYINAGIQYHSMTLLGLDQSVIANDAYLLAYQHRMTAETIGPGQTSDVLVMVPAAVPQGSKFPIYDGNFMLQNNGAAGYGGMMTFLSRPPNQPIGPDLTGPSTNGVVLAPNPTNGSVDVVLNAVTSDVATGGANIQTAEYFIDNSGGTPGTGTVMTATDGAFDSPTEALTTIISSATLLGLPSGNHTFYVRGQDSLGNWGVFNFVMLNLDMAGPTSNGLWLMPNPSNGSVNVALHATGDDRLTGNGNVVAAEYFIGVTGAPGTGTPMTVSPPDRVVSLDAIILAADINALSEGSHTVSVRSQDAFGNWGLFGTIELMVDKTGPTTSGVLAVPNPNNGTLGVNSSMPYVRVTALISDPLVGGVQSNINSAEGFIDTVGANGTGFLFVPVDGVFNSPTETGYSDIPLTTINLLAEGPHIIYVHGKDTSGNWGVTATVTFIVDKTSPGISNLLAVPNPTNTTTSSNTSFVLSATATDPVVLGTGSGSNIVAAEWFEGADPGIGLGNAMTGAFNSPSVSVSATINFVTLGWVPGNHTLSVRAKDAAGNWSATSSLVVTVVMPNNIFADGFDTGDFSAWSSAFNVAPGNLPGISVQAVAAQSGPFGMQARVNGNTPGYVTDGTPTNDPGYNARFYFNPHSTTTGNVNQAVTIFAGQDAVGATIFQVQYRRLAAGGGTYQVRLSVLRAGGTSTTNWYTITNNAWNSIEIAWQSATNATARLYTNGSLRQSLTNLNTSAYLLDAVQLGPSAGLVAGATGTMYFDSFVSTRRTVIGGRLYILELPTNLRYTDN
jgi:FtsP/CotA-like multicopper oxidase with cupredoxin domain